MADNPPITTSVPETVTVDTGADSETLGSLTDSFKDFWAEADAAPTSTDAPPAPSAEGAAQETREIPETKPEVKPPPARESRPESRPETKPPETKIPETDDDIERLEPHPKATPEIIKDFRDIKERWKAERLKVREQAARATQLEQELTQARQHAWTPEARADYEHAAAIRRRFDFASDPEFVARYHQPIRAQYESILNETVNALPERQAAIEWAQHMAQNYSPDQLDREWWLQSVINKIPNELERQSVLSSVTDLLKMQRERDAIVNRVTGDRSAFDNWIREKAETTASRVQQEIMTEIGIQEQRIAEVLPRNIEEAKTREEREAIGAHNERFERLNNYFKNTMQDLSQHGPRAWVRASVEATRSLILEENFKEMEKELSAVKAERDRYKAEIDKIAGVRKKLSQTAGTPPTPPGGKKDTNTLSIKDLDVRKSFRDYDWGDNA